MIAEGGCERKEGDLGEDSSTLKCLLQIGSRY
jgi:hypothetical protein